MITLLQVTTGPREFHVTILLDMSAKEVKQLGGDSGDLVKDATAAGRKVGAIVRTWGNAFFTYDAANRGQTDTSLISAFLAPQREVVVNNSFGGGQQWKR